MLVIVKPSLSANHPTVFHIYEGSYLPESIIACLSSADILSPAATSLSNSSKVSPAPCASAKAIP